MIYKYCLAFVAYDVQDVDDDELRSSYQGEHVMRFVII